MALYQSLTNSLYAGEGSGGITASSTDTLTNKTIDYNNNTITNLPGGAEFTATAVKSAAYTAVSGDWVLCDANAAAGNFDITLPASPTTGDAVRITLNTEHATRIVEIDRNSSTIDGGTAAEFEDYNKLWRAGDTVTFRCVASGAWVTAERQIANRFTMRAWQNPAMSNLTNATWTVMELTNVGHDYNGDFDNVTNFDYTIPISGIYTVAGSVLFTNTIVNTRYSAGLFSGATGILNNWQQAAYADLVQSAVVGNYKFAAGDIVTLKGRSNSGDNTVDTSAGEANIFLSMDLLSRN